MRRPRSQPRLPSRFAYVFLALFALVWCTGVGALDFALGRQTLRQYRSASFATTTGTVTSSQVEVVRSMGTNRHHAGPTYRPDIRYTYTVADPNHGGVEAGGRAGAGAVAEHKYTGTNYRFGNESFSDQRWAQATVRQFPPGSHPTVYYDPAQPDEAVLNPGLNGSDVVMLLYLTPFNLVGLGLISIPLVAWRGQRRPTGAGGMKWRADGPRLRVRLNRLGPVVCGLLALGLGSFANVFIVLIWTGGNPSLGVVLTDAVALLGCALGVAGWRGWRWYCGVPDLVIDTDAGTVGLPATFGRKQRETLALAEVRGVEVVSIVHHSSRQNADYHTFGVALGRRDGGKETLFDFRQVKDDNARQFAAWLRDKLGLPEADDPPP